jgi:hypothetical protein
MRQTLSYLKNKLGMGEPEHVVESLHYEAGEAPEKIELADTSEWQRLANLWRRAEKVEVSGATDADLRVTIASLEETAREIDRLMSAGLLTGAEADLLHMEMDTRVARLEQAMTNPRPNASGQSAGPSHPARIARRRLADRQGPLEQLSAAESLKVPVLKLVLPQVEEDVKLVSRSEIIQNLQPNEVSRIRRVREACRTALERIQSRLRGGASNARATAEWHQIRGAWREVSALAGEDLGPNERRRAEAQLGAAREAAAKLNLSGLMSRPEMVLLMHKADQLQERIRRNAGLKCARA